MFYLVGLGLGDVKDITVKGLEIVKKCSEVYLESYTSILTVEVDKLEEFYGKKVIVADREFVEQDADQMLNNALDSDIALLVVGDPFGATTHTDLILRAREKGIPYQVVHNASILNAVGCTGLQLYNFGETVSIPYWTETWQPDSFYDKILSNYNRGLHTLCLLDIKVKEPTLESLTKKKKEYMPPKFMSVSEAAGQLLTIFEKKKNDFINDESKMLSPESRVVGVARVGSPEQKIATASLEAISKIDLGKPLHSLIIPGPKLHELEFEYVQQFVI